MVRTTRSGPARRRRPGSFRGSKRLSKSKAFLPFAGLLLIIILLWAASLGWWHSQAQPQKKTGISDVELLHIEQRQRAHDSVIDYRRIDQRLDHLIERRDMIGMAVGVVENGQIRFLKGYGETVAGTGDKVTPNTVFRWGSLSKGVAADMVSLLAGQGRLSLSDPAGKYAASLKLPGGNETKATIADILSHQLGLAGHSEDPKLEDGVDPHLLRSDLANLNAICSPGTCWSYQNVAYDASSEIVERITGKPYEQAVRDSLFGPLGMRSASLNRAALLASKSWARPYVGSKASKPVEVTDFYYRVPAAGGVNSSIKDLAIWLQAQMGLEPNVLPQPVLDVVQTPRVKTAGELGRMRKFRERVQVASYGLGWRVYEYAGHKVVAHRGGVKGYRSLIMFDPELKSGVVALWNSSTNQPGGLEFEVMDMLYRLPARDWLGLDSRPTPEQPEPEPEGSGDR
ncbi:MAG: class beta-lactamase-related serine hydrolase [Alphaproteobacteria bacterium]|nr:class beta-lactamase-related serine hydrolase [Alphaproteobacteria bacterium]MDB5721929.1 class beta-lactamase-related serine hydrolase [Alphaproteobacteria bacterium]